MKISFFEEFPEKGLEKAKLINFPSTLYIATKSLIEFKYFRDKLKKINPKIEAAYWPILQRSYWISPFSYSYELNDLIYNLSNDSDSKLRVLIDLEFPFLRPFLFFRNLFSVFKNKRRIQSIFKNLDKINIDLLTAEYPVYNRFYKKILEWLGLSYSLDKHEHRKGLMFYTSIIKNNALRSRISRFIIKENKKYPGRIIVGLGTIAIGVLGNEPVLKPRELDRDLRFLKDAGVQEAVIFRLGGLNNQYLDIIKKYL